MIIALPHPLDPCVERLALPHCVPPVDDHVLRAVGLAGPLLLLFRIDPLRRTVVGAPHTRFTGEREQHRDHGESDDTEDHFLFERHPHARRAYPVIT